MKVTTSESIDGYFPAHGDIQARYRRMVEAECCLGTGTVFKPSPAALDFPSYGVTLLYTLGLIFGQSVLQHFGHRDFQSGVSARTLRMTCMSILGGHFQTGLASSRKHQLVVYLAYTLVISSPTRALILHTVKDQSFTRPNSFWELLDSTTTFDKYK